MIFILFPFNVFLIEYEVKLKPETTLGRCLLRALDQKVRKLRTLLTADEDITTELDRIVCRLMKLALYTSKQRSDPPPANWMQLKLFDLLTLTEKAIERRRRHYFESYQMKPIEYCEKFIIIRSIFWFFYS